MIKSQINKKSAFSLIELSIVLLVVGIIIAGITQSSRLVNKMKLYMARSQTQSSPVHSIADLLFWFEATSEKSFANQSGYSEIEDRDTIKNWYDVSPLNSDRKSVSQDESTYQPTYIENGINGLPSVRFDSTNDDMRLTGDLGSGIKSEMTIFLVFKSDGTYNASGNDSILIDLHNDVANSISSEITNLNEFFYAGYEEDGVMTEGQNIFQLQKDQTVIITLTYNTNKNLSMQYLIANGDSARRSEESSASLDFVYNPLNLTIGNHLSQAHTFGGNVGEIIIFGRSLKTEEVHEIEEYLKKKWGISLSGS